MLKTLALVLVLVLAGCNITPQPSNGQIANTKDAPEIAYQLPSPPDPANPKYDVSTDKGLREYTTAVNWYLYQTFHYTRILNKYAVIKGWAPPDIEPLCETSDWPEMAPAPDVVLDSAVKAKNRIEWELAEYIRRTRTLYEDQREDFKQLEMWQRRLCNF